MQTSTHDATFGPLTWQPRHRCWEGRVDLRDGLEPLVVYVGTPDDERDQSVTSGRGCDQTITPEARAAFVRFMAAPADFTAKAADDLLAIHNEGWHHVEGGPPLTAEQFQARLTLESVRVESFGWIETAYHDGDLFWGHTVYVTQAADGSFPDEARFEG